MSVSFSAGVKAEICKIIPQKQCCAIAECFGVLLYCNTFNADLIRIVTESRDFAYMLPKLFRRGFGIEFDEFPSLAAPGKLVFQITDPEKLDYIMDELGFDPERMLSLHVNLSVLEDECCRIAFLRGAYLAGGSVTDPEKGYHMEIATVHQRVARESYALMEEVIQDLTGCLWEDPCCIHHC